MIKYCLSGRQRLFKNLGKSSAGFPANKRKSKLVTSEDPTNKGYYLDLHLYVDGDSICVTQIMLQVDTNSQQVADPDFQQRREQRDHMYEEAVWRQTLHHINITMVGHYISTAGYSYVPYINTHTVPRKPEKSHAPI